MAGQVLRVRYGTLPRALPDLTRSLPAAPCGTRCTHRSGRIIPFRSDTREECVRYIGNKTKLVPFLLETLGDLGLSSGVACDPFAGTASVGRALKSAGWRVHSGDLMAASYAYQVARVELDRTPRYSGALAGGSRGRRHLSYQAALRGARGAASLTRFRDRALHASG